MDKREFIKGSAATAAAMMMTGLTESQAFADDNVPRTNWSGNYHYSTNNVLQPASVSETQDAVRSVSGVRALGTRHSFNGIADSQIAQISTLKLKDVTLDPNTHTVTVGAGIRYGDLAAMLDVYNPARLVDGWNTVAGEEMAVGAGTMLYVAAHVEHRFHSIEEDLEVLVFFART